MVIKIYGEKGARGSKKKMYTSSRKSTRKCNAEIPVYKEIKCFKKSLLLNGIKGGLISWASPTQLPLLLVI